MNSSPSRSVRESSDTPAIRAMGLSPCPAFPATASATCSIVHRIVASVRWLSQGFGRSVHLVRKALLGACSPVEGPSFICWFTSWPAAPRPLLLRPKRATCQTRGALSQPALLDPLSLPAPKATLSGGSQSLNSCLSGGRPQLCRAPEFNAALAAEGHLPRFHADSLAPRRASRGTSATEESSPFLSAPSQCAN